MYKAPPQRELTEEEQITVNNGGTLAPTAAPGGIAGTGIGLAQVAPPPPPEANLAYKKSGESSNGVTIGTWGEHHRRYGARGVTRKRRVPKCI